MRTEIRELRTKMGFTQAQFARQLGVSTVCVVQWENGRRLPRQNNIGRMAELAGMNKLSFEPCLVTTEVAE